MNDPGLHGPINNAESQATDVLNQDPKDDEDPTHGLEERTNTLISPARWWYASTAFPLIAGTFGPMANAFSVCALVENWRVDVPPGGTEEHGIDIPDPKWLIAVNAVSLAFALIANLSLLLNMAKRVRFEIAQPITILGFWLASILLISLLAVAGTSHFRAPGVDDQALTQAFYYAIFAAALYQIISYLMCITVWGAYIGAYSKDFSLTVAQRTLMLQTISFLVYLEIGALIYSKVEQWKFLDAIYWSSFTLLTVGIGDYSPKTHLGRSLLFPYAVGGIITVGLVVSSIRSLVLDRGAEKMSARVQEKIRARVVKQIAAADRKKHGPRRPLFGISRDRAKDLAHDPEDDDISELKRRKLEFETMRRVQEMATRERLYVSLLVSTTAFAILWFVGAVVFKRSELNQKWSYFDGLYFSYTSILTIGYGDYYPMSNSGKPFFVFWSLLAVPTLTILISNMGDTVVKGVKDVTIWIGEISFLPSDEARTRDRLRQGAHWLTGGFVGSPKATVKQEHTSKADEAEEDWPSMKVLHPGLIKIFDDSDRNKINHHDLQVLDKLADVWARKEEEDEETAKINHDKVAEAEHHYRHLLITHISKIYSDTKLSTPKQYSYIEWAFYLKLIGESESDSSSHNRPLPKRKADAHPRKKDHGRTDEAEANSHEHHFSKGEGAPGWPKWSWIGQQSPLMQDENEAEWILERLFQKLEASLRAQTRSTELVVDRDVVDGSHGRSLLAQ